MMHGKIRGLSYSIRTIDQIVKSSLQVDQLLNQKCPKYELFFHESKKNLNQPLEMDE